MKYKFYQYPEHVSEMTEYRKTIKFNDCNVVLLGTMNKERLFEYLRGPLLKIEIHDRDPKEISQQKSLVFGSQPEDNSIWNNTGNFINISKCSWYVARTSIGDVA